MNAQAQATPTTETQATDTEATPRASLMDGWYDARCASFTFGPGSTGHDQIVWDLDVLDPTGGSVRRMLKYNDMSTKEGLSILMDDAKYLGCKGFKISEWVVDTTLTVRVVLETEEYPIGSGDYTQKVKKIKPKRPQYEPAVAAKKSSEYEVALEQALARNIDYQQREAAKQAAGGGRSGGRSNSLQEPAATAASNDFQRTPTKPAQVDFTPPGVTPPAAGAKPRHF